MRLELGLLDLLGLLSRLVLLIQLLAHAANAKKNSLLVHLHADAAESSATAYKILREAGFLFPQNPSEWVSGFYQGQNKIGKDFVLGWLAMVKMCFSCSFCAASNKKVTI